MTKAVERGRPQEAEGEPVPRAGGESAQSRKAETRLKKAVLVLGPHRSGTSAVARVVNLLGAALPSDLMPPAADDNEAGFWEPQDIVAIHDEILLSAGSCWHDVSVFPRSWFSSDLVDDFRRRIVAILQRDFHDAALFVIKDPRMCRLVPFWVSVLDAFGAEPLFVIPVRHPFEVAASLKERDGFPLAKSLLVWLRHLLDAERDTRGYPRSFLAYDRLLRDWRSATGKISSDLGLSWPRASHEATVEIESFLSATHRHSEFGREDIEARTGFPRWVEAAYLAVLDLADGKVEDPSKALDPIREELDLADSAFGPVIAADRMELTARAGEVERLSGELNSLRAQLEARERQVDELEAKLSRQRAALSEQISDLRAQLAARRGEIDTLTRQLARELQAHEAVLASTSWRLTGPLRWASARARGGVAYLGRSPRRKT